MSTPSATPFSPMLEPDALDNTAARIVNRHAHDVRNHLNFLDLGLQILTEDITTEEGQTLVGKMKHELTQMEATLRSLLLRFNPPEPCPVSTLDLVRLWKSQIRDSPDNAKLIEWPSNEVSAVVRVDFKVIVAVLREITQMAWKRADGMALRAAVSINDGTHVRLEIQELSQGRAMPVDLLEEWAKALQANQGTLHHDKCPGTGTWTTSVVFPLLN